MSYVAAVGPYAIFDPLGAIADFKEGSPLPVRRELHKMLLMLRDAPPISGPRITNLGPNGLLLEA